LSERIIFLDIDGVIGDFDAHLDAQGKRKPDGRIDRDALDFQWWKSMPVFEGAREFHADLQKLAEVKFLTGPMVSVDCFGGKAAWISQTFLPQRGKWALTDLIICHSKRKGLLAGEGRILVDDTLANIEQWQAAGGIGIHHKGDFKATLDAVHKALAALPAPQSAPPIRASAEQLARLRAAQRPARPKAASKKPSAIKTLYFQKDTQSAHSQTSTAA